MNVHLLIDAVVRQTTILLAQLATSGGARAGLGHAANQVFLELASELRGQGLNHRLIADLFGLSLRTYHNKIRRLSDSSTDRGQPLWNAVLDFIQSRETVKRSDVLVRFCKDDEATIKSMLHDFVRVGVVTANEATDELSYHELRAEESDGSSASEAIEARESLLWILIARNSPLTQSSLKELSRLEDLDLERGLSALLADNRISQEEGGSVPSYSSRECIMPLGQGLGWEASVFDHYQTVVTAICAKLALGRRKAERNEHIGGSTYSFEVWPEHPLYDEGVGLLQDLRDRAASLRARVDEANLKLKRPTQGVQRVAAYVGQNVTEPHEALEATE